MFYPTAPPVGGSGTEGGGLRKAGGSSVWRQEEYSALAVILEPNAPVLQDRRVFARLKSREGARPRRSAARRDPAAPYSRRLTGRCSGRARWSLRSRSRP